jgi:hypothetical protein
MFSFLFPVALSIKDYTTLSCYSLGNVAVTLIDFRFTAFQVLLTVYFLIVVVISF